MLSTEFQLNFGAVILRGSQTITFLDTSYKNSSERYVVWLPREEVVRLCHESFLEIQHYYDVNSDIHLGRISSPPMEKLGLPHASYYDGSISFINGRHRTLGLVRAGAEIIPFDMDVYSLKKLQASGCSIVAFQTCENFAPKLKPLAGFASADLDPIMCLYRRNYPDAIPMRDAVATTELALEMLGYEVAARQTLIETLKSVYEREHHERDLYRASWRLEFLQTIMPAIRGIHDAGAVVWQEGEGYPYAISAQPAKEVAMAWLKTVAVPSLPVKPAHSLLAKHAGDPP